MFSSTHVRQHIILHWNQIQEVFRSWSRSAILGYRRYSIQKMTHIVPKTKFQNHLHIPIPNEIGTQKYFFPLWVFQHNLEILREGNISEKCTVQCCCAGGVSSLLSKSSLTSIQSTFSLKVVAHHRPSRHQTPDNRHHHRLSRHQTKSTLYVTEYIRD